MDKGNMHEECLHSTYSLCTLMVIKDLNQPKERLFDLRITWILFLAQTKFSISPIHLLIKIVQTAKVLIIFSLS
jgi:hypothetical protein